MGSEVEAASSVVVEAALVAAVEAALVAAVEAAAVAAAEAAVEAAVVVVVATVAVVSEADVEEPDALDHEHRVCGSRRASSTTRLNSGIRSGAGVCPLAMMILDKIE